MVQKEDHGKPMLLPATDTKVGPGIAVFEPDMIGTIPPSAPGQPPRPLQRFVFRGTVGILCPLALAIYYIWTYVYWLSPSSHPTVYWGGSVPNAKFISWSWFILGAIGPNISLYSLAGAEASMLMTTRWRAKNTLQILTHCDRSWGRLSAWKLLGTTVINRFSRKKTTRVPLTPLWMLLFLLSNLSWSFVLSGLTLKTGQAYFRGTAAGANVLGLDATDFDQRDTLTFMTSVLHRWQLGTEPVLPLAGSLLAEEGSNLTNVSLLSPNTLPPDTQGHIFLSPQASVPVTGSAWGLSLRYNCTEIQRLEDFTILSKRNASNKGIQLVQNIPEDHGCYNVFDDSWICVQNQTLGAVQGGLLSNIHAWMEVGANIQRNSTGPGYPSTYASSQSPGLDYEDVLEVLLWESIAKGSGGQGIGVQNPVSGIQELHVDEDGTPMDAVGVRCTSYSAVGDALVNGVAGRFADFHRHDAISGSEKVTPGIPTNLVTGILITNASDVEAANEIPGNGGKRGNIRRLGVGVSQLFFLDNYLYQYDQFSDWISPLFSSAGFTTITQNNPAAIPGFTNYASVLQASDLQRSILLAYKSYALQAIYNGDDGLLHDNEIWQSPNLTTANLLPILDKNAGGIPPLLVLILMCLWAAGCAILCALYGLRKRWSERLDGYSLFCFGVDAAQNDPALKAHISVMDDPQDSETLVMLPGLVGDSQADNYHVGHITLVDRDVADSTRSYG
ncbi:hypothetical protein B7463_g11686, partial [Scytalidium lignicola]